MASIRSMVPVWLSDSRNSRAYSQIASDTHAPCLFGLGACFWISVIAAGVKCKIFLVFAMFFPLFAARKLITKGIVYCNQIVINSDIMVNNRLTFGSKVV